MASIQLDIPVDTDPSDAWDAVADFAAVHVRLVPRFLADCRVDGADRVVTFGNGAVARERLVSLDPTRRRLVYSVVESSIGLTHHQAAVEVLDAPSGSDVAHRSGRCGSTIRWSADLLPDELAPMVRQLMEQGAAAIARTLSAPSLSTPGRGRGR